MTRPSPGLRPPSPRSRGARGNNFKSSPSPRSRGEGARMADEGRVIRSVSEGHSGGALSFPIYPLARDYAAYLKSWSIGDETLKQAAKHNLDHGPDFADWSFA